MRIQRITACLAVGIVALLVATPAEARKPIVSYVEDESLGLYDLELGAAVATPPITIPGMVPRYSMSLDGRYVVWVDDAVPKAIHLFDRESGAERPLPGIDVYMNPGNPSVSNTGLVGFDDNGSGPARVYDSAAGSFVSTGLDAANGHRQTELSGDGRFLATTCFLGCEVDLGSDASAYVQDLGAQADTGFPDNLTGADDEDEERPCVDADGSLVGIDITNPMQRDVFLYDRTAGAAVPLPGLNDPVADDAFCIIDSAGDYVGYLFDNAEFRIYERASGDLLTLPSLPFDTSSRFSDPYPPPEPPTAGELELTVSGKGRQRLRGRRPKVRVRVGCNVDCEVEAGGRVVAKAKQPRGRAARAKRKIAIGSVEKAVAAGERRVLKLRISRGAARKLDRLDRRGASLKAKILVEGSTAAGDVASARFRAKLRT